MVKRIFLPLVICALACTLSSCDGGNPPEPVVCDVDNPVYTDDIETILLKHKCVACHNEQSAEDNGDIYLETYAKVKIQALDSARLYGSVAHLEGFEPMPDDEPQIDSCDIKRIKAWVDAGAPQ